jgi:hypothetical protein
MAAALAGALRELPYEHLQYKVRTDRTTQGRKAMNNRIVHS